MDEFDFIIVGAGSAGCVLANRLSADPRQRVLLVEDGGTNQHPFIKMAGGFVKMMGNPEYFRAFPVVRQPGRRPEMQVYGKGLGGSSAINGTWYLPGMPGDFDGWEASGLPGWGWEEIARCYKQFENYRDAGAHDGRGQQGELQITPSTYASPVFDALVKGSKDLGLAWCADITKPRITGIGRTQYTVDRRGVRASAYEAFVKPVKARPNLRIATGCIVKRITIADGRATGIICAQAGRELVYRASGEVIVAAGVFGSPHLLQLSGIGPAKALAGLGISLVSDLPAVGDNFSDHQKLGISYDLHNDPGTNREFTGWRLYCNAMRYFVTGNGPLARVGMPLTGLVSTEGHDEWPEFQIAAAPFAMRTLREMAEQPGSPITNRPGITFSGYHLRPRGKGRVTLVSPDFRMPPQIDPAYWTDAYDQQKALELIRLMRRWAASPALARYVGAERMPGSTVEDDAALVEVLRTMMEPGLHGTGTCRMGIDPATSVTDARCRVHGIDALRVVDCSIMPSGPSGNTNGPAMAVGARAAELILEVAR